MPQRQRFRPYGQPTLTFVEMRQQQLELRRQDTLGPLWSPNTRTTIPTVGSHDLFPGKPLGMAHPVPQLNCGCLSRSEGAVTCGRRLSASHGSEKAQGTRVTNPPSRACDLFVPNSETMAGPPIHRHSYGSPNSPLPGVFRASRNIRSPSPVPM